MARSQLEVATLSLLLVFLTASSCVGREFIVGDGGGWVERLPGAESFNHWAERQRFHVNDTLVFRYKKKTDGGVLQVTQSHYEACNTTEPLFSLGGGDSRFLMNDTGVYFFIDADHGHCQLGERLIVIVESWHNSTSPPVPPRTQTPRPPKSRSAAAPAAPPSLPCPPPPSPSPFAANVSSPSPTPLTAPVSMSSAVASRAGVLATCLVVGSAIILA